VTAAAAPYVVAGWLVLVGLYGVVTSRHLIHLALSLSVTQSAVWILLLAVGAEEQAVAPIVTGGADQPVTDRDVADPVLQALSVTDIVVGAAVIALLLAFAVQIRKRCGTVDPAELRDLRG
jgi:multicomponent Na+:H+ antiporter subunit C